MTRHGEGIRSAHKPLTSGARAARQTGLRPVEEQTEPCPMPAPAAEQGRARPAATSSHLQAHNPAQRGAR